MGACFWVIEVTVGLSFCSQCHPRLEANRRLISPPLLDTCAVIAMAQGLELVCWGASHSVSAACTTIQESTFRTWDWLLRSLVAPR